MILPHRDHSQYSLINKVIPFLASKVVSPPPRSFARPYFLSHPSFLLLPPPLPPHLTFLPQQLATMAGIILIAGANSALGLSLIEPFLSQYPTYNVLATVRNASPKEDPDTAKLIELVSKYPGANITIEALDLSDVSAVQSFASDLSHRISKKLLPQILLLICNDMVFNPKGKQLWPIDGHDDMFQVFNEGRFRLVLRLLDSMVPKKGRIGLLSSISHDTEPAYLAPPFNSNDDLPVRVPKESKRGQRYRDTPRPVDASWDALHRSLRVWFTKTNWSFGRADCSI